MKFKIVIESDKGAFKCAVDDIQPTRIQDAIEILCTALDKVIEAYKVHNEATEV